MQLVPREVLFDIMKHKEPVHLAESDGSSAFAMLCRRADSELKKALREADDEDDAMEKFSKAMHDFMRKSKKCIRYVGDGSSRVVYAMADGTAIKLAKNKRGIAQNWQEAKTCMDPRLKYQIFPEFYGADKKQWLALNCELCAKAESLDFKEMFMAQPSVVAQLGELIFTKLKRDGKSLDQLLAMAKRHAMQLGNGNLVAAKLASNLRRPPSLPFKVLRSLLQFWMDNGVDELISNDLANADNWGITFRDGQKVAVVIDAGFSEAVFQSFY